MSDSFDLSSRIRDLKYQTLTNVKQTDNDEIIRPVKAEVAEAVEPRGLPELAEVTTGPREEVTKVVTITQFFRGL